jgi:ubiquinone/menaquinone biosynthesis C-methylase UbiE
MTLTIAEWHQRYKQQAGWSAELRRQIYSFPWFVEAQYIVEFGCGTGAVFQELTSNQKHCVVGLDIESEPLLYAASSETPANLIQADGYSPPFPDSTFDISLCHYLLLWTKKPNQIIQEMVRVTKSGGWILAFAEPDYGGRIDYPVELEALGEMQIHSLLEQGANPGTGRRLRALFSNASLTEIVCGIFGAQWIHAVNSDASIETNILESDYESISKSPHIIPKDRFYELMQLDRQAWENHTRVLFVPTFYAWGKVNKG